MTSDRKGKEMRVDYFPHRIRVAGSAPQNVSIVAKDVAVIREFANVEEIQSENVAREEVSA
jgi:hypothetical protein